jgi:hypothetical protein
MKIQLTDEFVLTCDSHNFVLNQVRVVTDKKSKNFGKTVLDSIGFYTNIPSLIEALITKKMMQSTRKTLNGLLSEHSGLCDEMRALFKVGIDRIGKVPCDKCRDKKKGG